MVNIVGKERSERSLFGSETMKNLAYHGLSQGKQNDTKGIKTKLLLVGARITLKSGSVEANIPVSQIRNEGNQLRNYSVQSAKVNTLTSKDKPVGLHFFVCVGQ